MSSNGYQVPVASSIAEVEQVRDPIIARLNTRYSDLMPLAACEMLICSWVTEEDWEDSRDFAKAAEKS